MPRSLIDILDVLKGLASATRAHEFPQLADVLTKAIAEIESLRKVGQKVVRKRIEDEINMQEIAEGSTCLSCEG